MFSDLGMKSLIIGNLFLLVAGTTFALFLSRDRFLLRGSPLTAAAAIIAIIITAIRFTTRFTKSSLFVKDTASFGTFPTQSFVVDDVFVPDDNKSDKSLHILEGGSKDE